jgi:hypothetical protein
VTTAIRIATETAPKFDIRSTSELIDDAKVVGEIRKAHEAQQFHSAGKSAECLIFIHSEK